VPWSALALVGSFELLMLLIRKHHQADANPVDAEPPTEEPPTSQDEPEVEQDESEAKQPTLTLERTVRELHTAGHSQRSIARDLNLDRRKVKQIIDREAA
jgi:DNA-binding NarL/FixJ family response regulator